MTSLSDFKRATVLVCARPKVVRRERERERQREREREREGQRTIVFFTVCAVNLLRPTGIFIMCADRTCSLRLQLSCFILHFPIINVMLFVST